MGSSGRRQQRIRHDCHFHPPVCGRRPNFACGLKRAKGKWSDHWYFEFAGNVGVIIDAWTRFAFDPTGILPLGTGVIQMTDSGTLILEKYRQAATQEVNQGQYQYGGLEIHAWRGIHESVGSIASRVFPTGSTVLDMAAGSGAMCLRLKDAGLTVTGCDLVSENFRLHGSVPFILANLNRDLPAECHESFDGVTATEIIEHLENPRHFLRQCFSALKPGGHLILTTPNVDSAIARSIWIRSGNFKWFTERDYRNEGHITPLPLMVLRNAVSEAGFQLVEITSAGEEDARILSWWKIHALAAILRAADGCDTPQKVALVVLAQKPSLPVGSS